MSYIETMLLHNELLIKLNPILSSTLHNGDRILLNNLLSILLNVPPIVNPHEWPLGSNAYRLANQYFEYQLQKVKEVEEDLQEEIMRCQKSNHCKRDHDGARAVSDSLEMSSAGPDQGIFQFPLPLELSEQSLNLLYDSQEKRKSSNAKAMLKTAPKSYNTSTQGGNWAAVFAFNRLIDTTTGSTVKRGKASTARSCVTNKTRAKLDSVPRACTPDRTEFKEVVAGEVQDAGQATETYVEEQEDDEEHDENDECEVKDDDEQNDTDSLLEPPSSPSPSPVPPPTTPSPSITPSRPTTSTSQHLPTLPQTPATPRIKRIMTKRIPSEAVTHIVKRVPLEQLHLRRPLGELEIITKGNSDTRQEDDHEDGRGVFDF